MNITSPIQPINQQPVEKGDLFLRVNQRVAGEILNISNDQVIVAINGVPIVAQMTSSEQLAMLMDKRYAFFVVKDISDKVVTLQLAAVDQGTDKKQATTTGLSSSLLEQIGVNPDKENMSIINAALGRGLKITPELIIGMRNVLDSIPGWGDKEAQLAAAIKSAGLALSDGTISLAQNSTKDIKNNFSALISQLESSLYRADLSDSAIRLVRDVISSLRGVLINGGDQTSQLEMELINSIKNLGISIENNLEKLMNSGNQAERNESLNNSLLLLSNLRREIRSDNDRLGITIDRFLEGVKWMQFLNSEVDHPIGKGQWTQIDLPISFAPVNLLANQNESIQNLKIRVSQDEKGENGININPNYTRLVIQVELNDKDIIGVDLSIVQKHVGAEISANNKELCTIAAEELSELKTGLEKLGYTLETSRIELGNANLEMDLKESRSTKLSYSSIDLGV